MSALAVVVKCSTAFASISGFNSGTGWTANNSAFFFGQQHFVTTVNNGGSNSAFFQTKQSINQFVAHFTYTDAANGNQGQNPGNGVTFVMQNDVLGPSAVSSGGGSAMGYGNSNQITPSVAVEFNIDDIFTPPAGTALGINGSVGNYVPTGLVNMKSGNPIDITLTYAASSLTEQLVDSTAGTNYSRTFSIDLVGPLGSSAYIGFTGGAGLDTATQVFTNFSFNQVPEPSSVVLAALALAGLVVWGRKCRKLSPQGS